MLVLHSLGNPTVCVCVCVCVCMYVCGTAGRVCVCWEYVYVIIGGEVLVEEMVENS